MQRRKPGGLVEVKHAPLRDVKRHCFDLTEVKLASTTGTFSGYGAIFGNTDRVGDVIEKGAFASTIADWKARKKWPKMMLQHGGGFLGGADDMTPCGIWTDMSEDNVGLKVEGQLIALSTERGTTLYECLKTGAIDSLSIGYRARKYRYGTRPDEPDRYLEEVELVEVSLVTFPANERATVSSVKNMTLEDLREFEAHLRRDAGFSKADAATVLVGLKKFDAWRCRDDGVESPRDEVQSLSAEEREALASVAAISAKFAPSATSTDVASILQTMGRFSALAQG